MAKKWIATYIDPATGVDRNEGDTRLVRHKKNCHYLRPDARRPFVGRRKASKPEMTSQPPCKRCG